MVSGFISRLVILIFGTLYPAYASYKAVRTKNVKEYVKWMMYWIVFALFTCAETFTDLFLSFWFPFYYEIKIITVIYLLSPATKGSSILYRKFVHPVLTKREQEIDEYIAKAKEQGYHTMLNLGSKGVNYATSLIMQTAIKGLPNLPLTPSSDFLPAKNPDAVDLFDLEDEYNDLKVWGENSVGQGGGGLVNQLRKSYSLSDLREEKNEDDTDSEGPRLIRRHQAENPRQSLPENHREFHYTEDDGDDDDDDYYQQAIDANGVRPSKGNVLSRTASLGPSGRIRTRAINKSGLPKRASVAEGSTRSAVESHESQNETDNFGFPFTHSSLYPSALTSFPPHFLPEYQNMFNNLIHNQTFAFISHPQFYSNVLNNRAVTLPNSSEGNIRLQSDGTFGNHPVFISGYNSNHFSEVNSKGDSSDAVDEVEIDNNENVNENLPSEENNERDEQLTETKAKEEEGTTRENLLPSLTDGFLEQKKQSQKRSKNYKKKPAPTPPTEQSVSKGVSNLTVEDEDTEFFTPNASPQPSRKQNCSSLDEVADTRSTDTNSQSKTRKSITTDIHKKNKAKKIDINVSKRLIIPKMSFSFWNQKAVKQPPKNDSYSIASVESASKRGETESVTEFFIPLRDSDEKKENNAKEDPQLFSN